MKKVLSVVGVALLVLGIGYRLWNDPEVQKRVAPARTAAPRAAAAPVYATAYAQAFCDANAAVVAAGTNIDGINEANIAEYFAQETAVCSGIRYLGAVTDGGMEREVFVLSFAADREDWIVLSFDTNHKVITFKRG